jgi:hypothetical protein
LKTSRSERRLDRTRRPRRAHAVVAALLSLAIPGPAAAQAVAPGSEEASSDPKLAEARTAFKEGTSLARQAQWGEALLAFERSQNLRPHTFTTYNIGYCERALGRYTRARKLLAKALAENDARGGTALSADVVNDARKYLAEMDKRVARATVTLAPSDAAVAVDGRPLEIVSGDRTAPVLSAGTRDLGAGEVPQSASFELLLDPGSHVFTVSRAGSSDLVVARTFAAGAVTPLDLKLVVVKAAPVEDNHASAAQAQPVRETKGNKISGYLLLGVGAAGLATGSVAGILAIQSKHKLDQGCGTGGVSCSPSLMSEHDALNRWADISTAAFSVGAVAIGVSTVLLLTSGSKATASGGSATSSTTASATGTSGLVIHPAIGYSSAFLTGSF